MEKLKCSYGSCRVRDEALCKLLVIKENTLELKSLVGLNSEILLDQRFQ